jgi:Signal transduction histidine kinase
MKIRYYALVLLMTSILGILIILFALPVPESQVDITEINDVTATLAADFDKLGTAGYTLPGSDGLDYAVIDAEENLRAATRRGLSEDVHSAIQHGDIIVDITKDGQVVGKVIFWNDNQNQWNIYRRHVQLLVICVLIASLGICAVFLFDLYIRILKPFGQMRGFAQRVAAGELDIPLDMDKRNAFGAFTESFDIMRDELRRAKENERVAEQSKRELVASLSHDIQTPVSSIRAVAELMEVTADGQQRQKLQIIQQKAGQIHSLVADLFHTTLEELNSLNVNPIIFPSDRLSKLIEEADYQSKAHIEKIPGCLVQADPIRLSQVIDNIIANSYKYANTNIDVHTEIDEQNLTLVFRDYGPGTDNEELPLLCSKYYRGNGTSSKNGYGLGLFISRNLAERMGGKLECENAKPGFIVKVWLKLDK